MEANAYRDDYVREDERDQYLAGMRLTWIASRFFNFSFVGAYSRLNYKHASYSFAESSGGAYPAADWFKSLAGLAGALSSAGAGSRAAEARRNGNEGGFGGGNGGGYGYGWGAGGTGSDSGNGPSLAGSSSQAAGNFGGSDLQDLEVVKTSRNDHLVSGNVVCDLFLTPAVNGGITAGYARLHSNDSFETYRQLQANVWISWDLAPEWRLRLDSGLCRTAYDQSPLSKQRTDKTYSAGAQLSRFFGSVEVYGKISWLKNNSIINSEFYHQMVTQCGFSLHF